MRIRFRTAALVTVFAGIVAFVAVDAARETTDEAPQEQTRTAQGAAQNPSSEAPSQAQTFSLPERSGLGTAQTPLFESRSWQPPPPKAGPPPPPAAPTAPPLPFTFAGKLIQDGRVSVLLSRGDSVIPVQQGETVDGIYKVESITDAEVTLVYLPLGQRQTLPVTSALASPGAASGAGVPPPSAGGASARTQAAAPIPTSNVVAQPPNVNASTPATLAWAGPPQVKLGSRFEVTLRVNSSQPISAWPMQLRFDPEQLEVVTVKPGKLSGTSDPNFSYRVSPNGSIFVGASLRQPAPAADAELLALTLRPLKAASAAEVAIASLSLHGAAGSPVPHDHIAAFRTAITP
jgi:hypothetical protein